MALTRKLLSGMGLTQEQIDSIIEAHTETVDGLKSKITNLESTVTEADKLREELESTKKKLVENSKDSYKVKYEALKEDFNNYKTELANKEKLANKTNSFKALLKDLGIADKRIESIVKVSDIDSLEIDDNNEFKDKENLRTQLLDEWSDFITTTSEVGAQTPTPPNTATVSNKPYTMDAISKMSASEVAANYDAVMASLSNN